ncbi:hypothetical protein [Devosia sediminis]|uniref:Uncharacterized protein n=1 Tax=Devosia sediminis TaxID=2798801 RepID=A0A934MPW3_9HYPH|nr:hypothetical protein [Devosia sediminis]MBJ3783754.1 hypothetical protein [Devosia sediminis]
MKGVLIGGTSHCGKSTLAADIGTATGAAVGSTDQMARHPGRPWLGVPEPVAEFYETLSDETIYWFLRVHHTNMWPMLALEIERQRAGGQGFVLEGTALRPESLAGLAGDHLVTLCLCANADFLVDRIRRESDYEARDTRMRRLIDRFVTRSIRDNAEIIADARKHGVWLVDAGDMTALATARQDILSRLSP